MEWNLARAAIRGLETGTNLNTEKSNYRFFIGITENAVKVQIGENAQIVIPDEVLKICFHSLSTPQGYSTRFFQEKFPKLYKNKDCHVHAIGQLFVKAGLARESNKRYFLK